MSNGNTFDIRRRAVILVSVPVYKRRSKSDTDKNHSLPSNTWATSNRGTLLPNQLSRDYRYPCFQVTKHCKNTQITEWKSLFLAFLYTGNHLKWKDLYWKVMRMGKYLVHYQPMRTAILLSAHAYGTIISACVQHYYQRWSPDNKTTNDTCRKWWTGLIKATLSLRNEIFLRKMKYTERL